MVALYVLFDAFVGNGYLLALYLNYTCVRGFKIICFRYFIMNLVYNKFMF
jgi:hypothetical protein